MKTMSLIRGERFVRAVTVVFLTSILTACGGGAGNGSQDAQAPVIINPPPVLKTELSLIAGNIGGPGNLDGTGIDARFSSPRNIASDMAGNLYVADHCTVRKIAPGGVVTTWAGNPIRCESRDGQGNNAGFELITGLAVAPGGTVYVADNYMPERRPTIRKISSDGTVTTLAGAPGDRVFGSEVTQQDGVGSAAVFGYISAMALDGNGNVYVMDWLNSQQDSAVRKITASGVVTTEAHLPFPLLVDRLAIDTAGNFLIKNPLTNEIVRIGRDGTQTIVPLPINTAQSERPVRFAVDARNNIYVFVSASTASRIIKVDAVTGAASTIASTSGPTTNVETEPCGLLSNANDIAIDSGGNIFVSGGYMIQKITPDGAITTYAGAAQVFGRKDGIGSAATFDLWDTYTGIASDTVGNLYVTDPGTVRRISPSGQVITIAGSFQAEAIDGKADKARFTNPAGITVDMAGNIYVTDMNFARTSRDIIFNASIRKISTTGDVSTFAGAREWGYVDGSGEAARFASPIGIVTDHAGNLYVADSENCVIRKITPDGTVTTFAGVPCLNGPHASQDGVGNQAQFANPVGITINPSGTLYVSDFGADALSIRKITPTGAVSTLARGAYGNASGPGAPIQFGQGGTGGIAADAAGYVYLADTPNHSIRRVGQDGVVTTIVGDPASTGIRLGASPSLDDPYAIAVLAPNVLAIRTKTSVLKLTLQ